MALSSDLISKFVKITNDTKKDSKETTVYGTVKMEGETPYVILDGSTRQIPVSEKSTAQLKDGNRVTVLLKNHAAIVTGNLVDPSSSISDVNILGQTVSGFDDRISDCEEIAAKAVTTEILNAELVRAETAIVNKVDTDLLEAERARITTLETDNVQIKNDLTAASATFNELKTKDAEITGTLEAHKALIDEFVANNITTEYLDAHYATIGSLNSTNAEIDTLKADYGSFSSATANELEVMDGDIYNLKATTGKIGTLIFGSATGNTIHSTFSNAVIAQLGDAQIKSAMIESISASKITAGDINTNQVRVVSDEGTLVIADETIQISDGARVRVQIGKDASNDYSINIWDSHGDLMFSQGGITEAAIKDAIIIDDMVSDDANISAAKLNIDSLFEVINDSSNTIKSTRVYLDENKQTLDVAFKTLTTDVTEMGETVKSQGTAISTVQGQISSKVWQQDIDTAKSEMNTQYSNLNQTVDGISSEVGRLDRDLDGLVNEIDVTNGKFANYSTTSAMNSAIEQKANSIISSVSSTYASKTELSAVDEKIDDGLSDASQQFASINEDLEFFDEELTTLRRKFANYSTTSEMNSAIEQKADSITSSVSSTYATKTELNTTSEQVNRLDRDLDGLSYEIDVTNGKFANYSTTSAMNSAIEQKANSIISSVSSTYASKTELNTVDQKVKGVSDAVGNVQIDLEDLSHDVSDVNDKFANYSTTAQMNSAIEQKANSITSSVSSTYATKTELNATTEQVGKIDNDLNGLADELYTVNTKFANHPTTAQMNSAIEQKADSIVSSVSATYASKSEVNTQYSNLNQTVNGISSTVGSVKSDLENLTIGGRNLFSGYGEEENQLNDYNDVGSFKQFYNLTFNPADYVGKTFTISLWAKSPNGPTKLALYNQNESPRYFYFYTDLDTSLGSEWKYYAFTFVNTDRGETYDDYRSRKIEIYAPQQLGVLVKKIKVEMGNRATDWTAAPEDIDLKFATQESLSAADERLTESESLIQQLSDSIMTLVTNGEGESLMIQTENGWTFSTGEIQQAVNDTATDLANLAHTLDDVDTTINVLNQAVSDLGVLNDYVKIGTYESEPCIELGESDSEFKLVITNTRIMFMEGGNVPAYITNQSLHIEKAVIKEELQQGAFVWRARANGNLGLIWKGVNS